MNLCWLDQLQLPARVLLIISRMVRLCGGSPCFVSLPYDHTCPVIYDKDDVINCYTDDYVMALAASRDVSLRGILTSSSLSPHNRYVTNTDYERYLRDRRHSVQLARMSGMKNIPDPIEGARGPLEKPASGLIEDTRPIGAEGSWLIVREARMASPGKPLVVIAGAGLTAVADAYLLDASIVDRVVVVWISAEAGQDMGDYNGWSDGWAAYIALQKLRLVQFPLNHASPLVPKSRLKELPDTPLRGWMIEKRHSNGFQPGSVDADAPPAISLARKDYALRSKRVSFSHWNTVSMTPDGVDGHEVPAFRDDSSGNTIVITAADGRVATEEWWTTLRSAMVSQGKRNQQHA